MDNTHAKIIWPHRLDPGHARNYWFSLLQVFRPATPAEEIDAAESHFKWALQTRRHGLNRN